MPSDESPLTSGTVSADLLKRTSALKESLDNDWKNRVTPADHVQLRKVIDPGTPSIIKQRATSLTSALQEDWKARVPNNDDILRTRASEANASARRSMQVSQAQERLRQAGESWTKRIDDKAGDAAKFTVAAKLGQAQTSALFEGGARPQAPVRRAFRPSDVTATEEKATVVIEETNTERRKVLLDFTTTKTEAVQSTSIDDGFDSFFASAKTVSVETSTLISSASVSTGETVEMVLDDLPASNSAPLLTGFKKNLPKMTRNKTTASRNPVKTDLAAAAANGGLEKTSDLLEKVKIQSNAKMNPGSVKLAALTAKVDFSAAAKAILSMETKSDEERAIAPKLILVKGRRHIQVRLVEPVAGRLNDGDSFVVTSPNEVFVLIGEYSNKIETTKALDVAQDLIRMHDFGVKAEAKITRIPLRSLEGGTRASARVLELLQWPADAKFELPPSGPAEEDEEFEIAISTTNKIYELSPDGTLEPVDDAWGVNPSRNILGPDKKLVMDFGCEVYVWLGKCVEMSDRKRARRAGESLVLAGYDYDGCLITPFDSGAEATTPKSGAHRPSWTHFARVPQGRESILLRSKFVDWGETFAMNSRSAEEELKDQKDRGPTMDPDALEMTDGEELLASKPLPIPFEVEKVDLERGEYVVDGYMHREVVTHDLNVFRVANLAQGHVADSEVGQFYDEESYIVSWKYEARPVTKRLDGRPSQLPQVSRIRKVELFWHGINAPVVDRGVAAAHVSKRVEDEGSHSLELYPGREPALFVRLFEGRLMVLNGHRGDGAFKPRMFIVLGEDFPECYALEVAMESESLRSRGCLLLITASEIFLWIGKDATKASVEVARTVAENWMEKPPHGIVNPDSTITRMKEGQETTSFKKILKMVESPCVPLPPLTGDERPRVFHLHLCASTGAFSFEEIRSTFLGNPKFPRPPFPALQQNLYDKTGVPEGLVGQPGLFLIDNIDRVYLWLGVNEDLGDDRPDFLVLWNCTVKCAVLTMLSYGQEKKKILGKEIFMGVVTAGLEPPEFIQMFPRWTYDECAREINLENGHTENELLSPEDVLALHQAKFYTLEELRADQLPRGVIPRRREDYLSPEDFETLFELTREEFQAMPQWKRIELKKRKNLF